MTDDHDRLREWAGAYTIGALEPDDRREFESHLRTCEVCQVEVGRLAVLPGLLARIDLPALDDAADRATAEAIERRARSEVAGLAASRRRWRRLSVAAVVALVVVAVAALVPRTEGDEAIDLVIGATTAEAASIRAEPKGWGTELRAELGGLPRRDRYQLWSIDRDGRWTVAATWGPTAALGATVTGATSTVFVEIDRVLVTSGDRDDVLVEAIAAG